MTRTCHYCGSDIDTEHDEHYFCTVDPNHPVVCVQCHLSHPKCPECGRGLHYHEDSHTKQIYKSPGTRSLLGF